jgi:UDP-2,3-diacylglucosamine pyrophosphatase LpxH
MENLWVEEPPPREIEVAVLKPRVRVKASSSVDGEVFRICAIGDIHDSPLLADKSRLKWIARHITKTKPEKIVQIGDFGDFESCSTHEPFGSIAHAQRPSYKNDIESLEEALHEFSKEVFPTDIPKIVLEGNHEHRIYRFQNLHPETNGLFVDQLDQLWGSYGWKSHRYGEWIFIGGVGFTHAPMTIMGKPYGGKFSENAIGNDAIFSVVYGHTHRSAFRRVPKIGPSQSIEILNLGSAMPNNYIAKYAGTATTGWTYGIYDLELRGGHITGYHFISMETLEEMYGD